MSHLPLLVSFPDEPQSIDVLGEQLSWDSSELALARRLYRKRLPPLVDTACLPYLFGVSRQLMSAMGRFTRPYYDVFTRPKKGNGRRQIEAPRQFLKVTQWWINDHILSRYKAPAHVMGFVRGKSIFDNARRHTRGKNLMVVDIEDFFPSVESARVQRLFADLGFPDDVSRQLASLCCFGGRLPQGAPTSPTIANWVFLPADRELRNLARAWGSRYTRYADDLAFSGRLFFGAEHLHEVCATLTRHGFSANTSKSRRVGPRGRQIVTGLVVNVKAHPVRWKRRRWRATFHRASTRPHEFFDRVEVLQGIAAFVEQYDKERAGVYRSVTARVAELAQND